MRALPLLVVASLAFTLLAACEEETQETYQPGEPDTTTSDAGVTDPETDYSGASARQEEEDEALTTTADPEIIASLNANDDKEIAMTALAQEQTISQPVLDFANMLNDAHSRHKEETQALARELNVTSVEGATSQQIRMKGEQALAELTSLEGEEFERAFVQHMITGHTEALDTIDEALRTVTNDRLRQHLDATRTVVAEHLRQAQDLQAQLGG